MSLTDHEKEQLKAMIDRGEKLPAKFKSQLFENVPEVELVWAGKTSEVTNVVLPFQSIEQIDEPRKDANMVVGKDSFSLFSCDTSSGRQQSGWSNKLIWGDNKLVLSSLKNGPMREEIEKAGGLKLVYIDPPFDVGADFSFNIGVGPETLTKEPSIIEELAYRDTWGRGADSYLSMVYERLLLIKSLLASDGSIFVHIGPKVSHVVRSVLDDVFGCSNFINQIIWRRAFAHNDPSRCGMIHDVVLYYSNSDKRTWNKVLQKPSAEYLEQFFDQYDDARKERYNRIPMDAPRHGDGGNLVYEWKGAWPSKNRTWAYTIDKMEEFERKGRIHYPKKDGGMPRLKCYESEYEGTVLQDIWTDINKIHN
ncbi:DNA methyltransferase [Fundidesulfovibrio soli]|uniref:DNA methyltransferase n=1 Tax=Fundidesulfovibrio soli TaxID=2922716 RepID=UPI003014ECEB